jgi:hypothetical protein
MGEWVTHVLQGQPVRTVDLKPKGRTIAVTDANKVCLPNAEVSLTRAPG